METLLSRCYSNVEVNCVPDSTTSPGSASTSPSDTYHYEPLLPGHVRLIKILPGIGQEPVHLELEHVELVTAPPYCALSYVWGTPEPTCRVWVGDRTLEIGPNLHDALLRLRSPKFALAIWVDAIAINQGDNLERSQQILLMMSLYARAERVISWLGEGNGTMQVAFDVFSQWSEAGEARKSAQLTDLAMSLRACITDDRSAMRNSMLAFYCCPYFRRAWTLQESSTDSDRSPVFLCGSKHILHSSVRRAYLAMVGTLSEDEMKQLCGDGSTNVMLTLAMSDESFATSQMTFSSLVRHTSLREASRAHDYIYAYRGLFSAQSDSYPDPNYDTPIYEVYTSYTRAAIRIEQKLQALAFAASLGVGSNLQLPSWAVIPNEHHVDRHALSERCCATGSSAVEGLVEEDDRDTCLPLMGLAVGSIDRCFEVNLKIRSFWKTVLVNLADLQDKINAEYPDNPPPVAEVNAIVACLTGDDFFLTSSSRRHMISSVDACRLVAACNRRDLGWRAGELPSHNEILHEAATLVDHYDEVSTGERPLQMGNFWFDMEITRLFAEHVIRTAAGRRMVVTSSGQLALVPRSAQPGDHICLLLGGNVPYVLRQTDSAKGLYGLVGDAYVHGIMYGELYNKPGNTLTEYKLV